MIRNTCLLTNPEVRFELHVVLLNSQLLGLFQHLKHTTFTTHHLEYRSTDQGLSHTSARAHTSRHTAYITGGFINVR